MTIRLALDKCKWHRGYPVPRTAWDLNGALIAEALSETEAQTLIDFFTELTAFEGGIGEVFDATPGLTPMELGENDTMLTKMLASLSDGLAYLRAIAYPGSHLP